MRKKRKIYSRWTILLGSPLLREHPHKYDRIKKKSKKRRKETAFVSSMGARFVLRVRNLNQSNSIETEGWARIFPGKNLRK